MAIGPGLGLISGQRRGWGCAGTPWSLSFYVRPKLVFLGASALRAPRISRRQLPSPRQYRSLSPQRRLVQNHSHRPKCHPAHRQQPSPNRRRRHRLRPPLIRWLPAFAPSFPTLQSARMPMPPISPRSKRSTRRGPAPCGSRRWASRQERKLPCSRSGRQRIGASTPPPSSCRRQTRCHGPRKSRPSPRSSSISPF